MNATTTEHPATPDLRALVLAWVQSSDAFDQIARGRAIDDPERAAAWSAHTAAERAIFDHVREHEPPAEVRDAVIRLVLAHEGSLALYGQEHAAGRHTDADRSPWTRRLLIEAAKTQNTVLAQLVAWAKGEVTRG